jgi:hypothetical protein
VFELTKGNLSQDRQEDVEEAAAAAKEDAEVLVRRITFAKRTESTKRLRLRER